MWFGPVPINLHFGQSSPRSGINLHIRLDGLTCSSQIAMCVFVFTMLAYFLIIQRAPSINKHPGKSYLDSSSIVHLPDYLSA